MKKSLLPLLFALITAASLTNCTTAYDAYGNPHQVVTPEGALLGAAAVGLLAYGLASSDDDDDCDYNRHDYGPRHGYSRHHRGYRH